MRTGYRYGSIIDTGVVVFAYSICCSLRCCYFEVKFVLMKRVRLPSVFIRPYPPKNQPTNAPFQRKLPTPTDRPNTNSCPIQSRSLTDRWQRWLKQVFGSWRGWLAVHSVELCGLESLFGVTSSTFFTLTKE